MVAELALFNPRHLLRLINNNEINFQGLVDYDGDSDDDMEADEDDEDGEVAPMQKKARLA